MQCVEEASLQTFLGWRRWDLLPIFGASTGVSGTSSRAKAPSVDREALGGKSERRFSTTLLKFVTLTAMRHHGSCYKLCSHLALAGTCQFILSGHVTLDQNSKCSWHGARYFHGEAHRVYNIFNFTHSRAHSSKIFKTLLSLVMECIKLSLKSFGPLCSTECKTWPATFFLERREMTFPPSNRR